MTNSCDSEKVIPRVNRLIIVVTAHSFIITVMVMAMLLGGCVSEQQRLERIAYAKCGPDGTVDWDDNPSDPPPHCNRDGWNGHEYVGSEL